MNEIGKRIRETRIRKNLKQSDIAEKLNVTRVTVTNIENGKNKGNFEMLKQICEILNVSADFILFGKEKNDDDELNEEGNQKLQEYKELLKPKYPKEEIEKVGNL